jgi:hypothetical protein
VALEKCKKTAKITPPKSPWGDKNSRTTATETSKPPGFLQNILVFFKKILTFATFRARLLKSRKN